MTSAPAAKQLLGSDEPAPQPGRSSSRRAKNRPPNVILIMLDDLGSVDANCYGSKDLVTPNLDALAASGGAVHPMLFLGSDLLALAGLGAHGSLSATGRSAGQCQFASERRQPFGRRRSHLGAGVQETAGYVTGHVGKWHLGYGRDSIPNAKGFDLSFGHMGGCIDNYSHYFYWEGPNRHDLWENGKEIWREGRNIGDLTVERCHAFLEASKDQPFFLFWAINQPHYPLQGKAEWRDYYRHLPSPRSMYAASVSTLDELIGQVMGKVRDLGLAEETIVVLQSDHGHSTEERTFGGGGNAGAFRGAKGSLFEGGVRVVSMISWPGELPQGVVRDQLVSGCDWMPTLAELTGAPLPKRRIDGKSMVPVIRSADAPTQHSVLHWGSANSGPCGRGHGSWSEIQSTPATKRRSPKATNSSSAISGGMSPR